MAEQPTVMFGDSEGSIIVGSRQFIVARVPDGAASGAVVVSSNGKQSNPQQVGVAVPIAESLHPVANPPIDDEGNIYATFSGSRGQKTPVAIYRIDLQQNVKPFVQEMMNPTGVTFGRDGSPASRPTIWRSTARTTCTLAGPRLPVLTRFIASIRMARSLCSIAGWGVRRGLPSTCKTICMLRPH